MVPQHNIGQDTIAADFSPVPPVSENDLFTVTPAIRYEGLPRNDNPFHADWITVVILSIFILYAVVATFARHIFTGLIRLISFRTPGNPASDTRGIFQWQTTLANIASFASLSLFLFICTLIHDALFPFDANGFVRWLLLMAAVSLLITLRHLVTVTTGYISDNTGTMTEYLNNIYMLYRLMGIVLLPVTIVISYLPGPPPEILVVAGCILIIIVFIVRIIRLLTIFVRNSVPIFYFILYLCALEFLPGAILIKMLIAR